MKPVLLIDFGSTYTKLTAVDVESETLLGTAASYTTVSTDINEGLHNALALLEEKTGKLEYADCYACSSAAGGLRMITSGLVPELTGEAAKLASLGAGAKVIGVYAFQLTEDDIADIAREKPDILLLVGGTDGGNTANILHNARMLSTLEPEFPVVIAGNRTAARECERILEKFETHICPNVMPKFGQLQIEATQQKIREIFLNRIIHAKGLSKASELLSDIMMPTPAAVLQALDLLAQGCKGEDGIGELIAVDVGGATSDVYSITDGMPEGMNTVYKGLPEPYSKRTVEGDIGMRYSITGVADAAGYEALAAIAGLTPERTEELVTYLSEHTDVVPGDDPELKAVDFAVACMAVREAVARHAGTMEETYTLMGKTYVQTGKNLTRVKSIVVTGGSLIHSEAPEKIAAYSLYDPGQPQSLRPLSADVLVDKTYILAAMGLLSPYYPQAALRIMKKELRLYETGK